MHAHGASHPQKERTMNAVTTGFRVTGIDLTGYMVKDTQRALAFYRDVVGLEPTIVYPGDKGAEFELADGTTFGLWHGGNEMPWQPSMGVLFAVDDLDAAVATMKERGVALAMQDESPICFMAMFEDSEGNYFVLHKRKG
jgi:predicted enzyme related to lactoylglutathione lyase